MLWAAIVQQLRQLEAGVGGDGVDQLLLHRGRPPEVRQLEHVVAGGGRRQPVHVLPRHSSQERRRAWDLVDREGGVQVGKAAQRCPAARGHELEERSSVLGRHALHHLRDCS